MLCEVHDGEELQRALDAGCETIGVNNRNLHTFRVDLNTSLRLAGSMPAGVVKVAESGIESGDDIARLRRSGLRRIPGRRVADARAASRRGAAGVAGAGGRGPMTWVKICATTNLRTRWRAWPPERTRWGSSSPRARDG